MTESTENTELRVEEVQRDFWIPTWNLPRLEKKLAQMNKRANKIGCEPVSFNELERKEVVAPGYEERATIMGADWCPKITIVHIEIVGEGPVIEGWKFVGTLDHNTLPGAVIVNAVPGEAVPKTYHNHEAVCDHCGKIRRRNETFVLEGVGEEHEGEWQQVGRNCLKDFFGHDPLAVARWLTSLMKFVDGLGDEDEWFGGGGGHYDYTFDHNRILAATAAVVRQDGWVPRSKAGYDQTPTANIVMQVFLPPTFHRREDRVAYEKWVKELEIDKYEDEAAAAREWLKEQSSDNEYFHNLHAIDAAAEVPTRLFGYWCSLVASYQRAQERLRLAERDHKVNEHFGNVKDRVDLTVKVVSKRYVSGYYGTVTIVRMLTETGHTAIWFANTDVEMDEGKKYVIKGTIKKHDEYNNWKQTVLSRVKVIEKVEDAE